MELPGYTAVTALDRGDMLELSDEVSLAVWPEFMLNDPVANEHWSDLYLRFPGLQFGLVEARSGDFAAFGNCIPLSWDGDLRELSDQGWDWALERGFQDLEAGRDPNLVCALQVTVRREFRGRGASGLALRQMVEFTRELGCEGLIAPVRPTWKCRYPLTPMERYISWRGDDGALFDPWLALHARLGAELLKVCHSAMRITGSVADWESWTGIRFPESGSYVVPGALVPVEIDRERDLGSYVEPNVWMVHPTA